MQATTYKLSITSTWLLLLAIVLAGAGILIASSEDDPPVYGFTNETCDSERSMYFPRLSSLIAFDGETDGFGNTWNFGSYLEADASSYECHLVEFEEITVKGTRSSSSGRGFGAAGGGGGGRSSGGTGPGGNPAPENPADEFTEDKAEEIKSCWEEKVSEEDLDGWDSDAEADDISSWRNARGSAPGYGHTQGTSEGPGGELLTIGVTIYTDVIAAETRATFEHLVAFVQMHEKIHVFQYLREASDDDGITLPSPYEQHEMEVQAHNYSYDWWEAIHPDPPPFQRLSSSEIYRFKNRNGEYKGLFKTKRKEYMAYEEKRANGTLTTDDEEEMEKLENWFNARLPTSVPNDAYNPNMDLDCE